MSQTTDPKSPPSTASLSPEARALLAEINGGSLPQTAALTADAVAVPSAGKTGQSGILLSPQPDRHAAAFAELLDHIEDQDGQMHVDERAALAAAAKYRREKQAPPTPNDMADMADGLSDGADDAAMDDVRIEVMPDGDVDADDFNTDFDADFDDDAFDDDAFDDADFDLDEDEGKGGFFARFTSKGGGAVKRLIGFKDASSAYDAQSGSSLLPFTIIRAVVLVLVAAVPPLVNLIVIQPQISDNNRKLTQIRSFEAKSTEDKKIADELALKIARSQKAAKRRIATLMPDAEAQTLINRYLEAMQQFEVDLLAYKVTTKPERKVIAGRQVQEATVLQLDLISRYDIYVDIRKIFVEQANNIIVLDEVFETQPDSLKLKIKAEFMLPTFRGFDTELDAAKPKEEEGKK